MPVGGRFRGPATTEGDSPQINPKLDRLAWLLEQAFGIPGTRIRFGLDAIAGLIPGIGDAGGLIVGATLLVSAYHYRVPAGVLSKMAVNLGIDALFGAIPILGDVFDIVWKANTRNLGLLRAHAGQARSTRGYWLLLGALLAGLAGVFSLAVLAAVWMISWIIQHPF